MSQSKPVVTVPNQPYSLDWLQSVRQAPPQATQGISQPKPAVLHAKRNAPPHGTRRSMGKR